MSSKNKKRYTVTVKVIEDDEPTSRTIEIEKLGKGKIRKYYPGDAANWILEVEFQVDSLIEVMVLMDESLYSKSSH